jgi:hypothetical protein
MIVLLLVLSVVFAAAAGFLDALSARPSEDDLGGMKSLLFVFGAVLCASIALFLALMAGAVFVSGLIGLF